jgi:hypothetical protein
LTDYLTKCLSLIVVKLMFSKLLSCHRLFAMAAALCLGSLVALAQTNLFTNGSFESGITGWTTQYTTNSVTTTSHYVIAASPAAAGFTTSTNNVGAQSGSNALWVNGASSATTTNVVQQTITGLTIGQKYTVYGWLVSAENPVSSAATITIRAVSGATNVVSSAFTATTAWAQIYFTFTAGATNATITFSDTNKNATGTGNDFGLDNLFVPESGTYAAGVFLVGIGFFGWLRYRRSLASKTKNRASGVSVSPDIRA